MPPQQARDYIAVSHSGRKIAGPFRHYDDASAHAKRAGGYVKFAAEPATKYTRSRAAKLGHWARKEKRKEQLRRMGYTPAQIDRIMRRGY